MKNYLHLLLCSVLFFIASEQIHAQYSESGWLLGAGFNFVDESGLQAIQPFNANDNWSFVPYPSRFSIGYVLTNGIFFQSVASINTYKEGVIVDEVPLQTELNYFAIDGLVGYSFKNMIDPEGWFDPFVQTGLGSKRLGEVSELTLNLGGGFNFWLNERFAVNLITLGKWGLDSEEKSFHTQHGIGVVFKPNFGGSGNRNCYKFN